MPGDKVVAVNRRAHHEYDIIETYDAGLVLSGPEIKSVRLGKVSLAEGFAKVEGSEVWLHHVNISSYAPASRFNVDPKRSRKLLLHRKQIEELIGRTQEKGLTLVPLKVYLQRGLAKIELGLGRGRKLYDKREAIAKREMDRERQQALRQRV
jgi:SsrA-binding protein